MRVWNSEGGSWEGKESIILRKMWQDLDVEEDCSPDGSEDFLKHTKLGFLVNVITEFCSFPL